MSAFARGWYDIAPYLNIGWYFAVVVGLLTYLGYLADGRLGTGSLLTIVGAFLGIVLGFVNFFKIVLRKGQERRK